MAPVRSAHSVDLNADLGEGGVFDGDLLDVVTSASVACGLHAGGPLLMVETARRAAAAGVVVGAHPSYDDREGFGRRLLDVAPESLFATIVCQVGAMMAAASAVGTRVRYVKPHGALYNQAAVDPAVAEPVVRAVASTGLPLLCPAGSRLSELAGQAGLRCYTEAFADRAYAADGTLAGRDTPGSVLRDPDQVGARALRLVREGKVVAVGGTVIDVAADSICIHGDNPAALTLARSVRATLTAAGVAVRPFIHLRSA